MARSSATWWAEALMVAVVMVGVSSPIAAGALLPPRMSTQFTEIRVNEGETSVVLECSLDVGDDPIQYQWLKNHRWVTASLGYAYRGYRQLFLALHKIEKQHAGTYTCSASNEAGAHSASVKVIVEGTSSMRKPEIELPTTDEVLSDIAASLSDVLAEGECNCDTFFLLHASTEAPAETLAAQANLVHTIASTIISDSVRVGLAMYSDHVTQKLSLGKGVHHCALRNAFKDLSHPRFPTRLEPVFRETFKKFKKSKSDCKVLFLPVFGSAGKDGADLVASQLLKKLDVKVFILEVTQDPVEGMSEMASQRGDGRPYHWRVPLHIWPTIVIYQKYMTEEIVGCMTEVQDVPGECVGSGQPCISDGMCRGAGYGCFGGVCKPLQCNVNTNTAGCCVTPGDYWCGDVTRHCTGMSNVCDGRVQCMNGADEDRCWSNPCPEDKVSRCQSSTLCLGLMDLCDGEPACPGGEDEDPRFCRSFPCPRDRPFRCRSGTCIAKENVCDGIFKDCDEGEDEDLAYCDGVHVCPPSKPFKCDYGICIEERMQCDGHFNCLDAKDELLCSKKSCPASRPFKCLDGVCISMDKVCNGISGDCTTGEDENNCTAIPCPVGRSFKCKNGRCIDEWLKCNGDNDCGDGSDEVECSAAPSVTSTTRAPEPSCNENEFLCDSGACIPRNKVCDGRRNCLTGEDEQDCQAKPCPSGHFRCDDGTCITSHASCNGINDCADGSDEINCTHTEEDEDYEDEYEDYYKEEDSLQPTYTTSRPVVEAPVDDTLPEYTDGTDNIEEETIIEDSFDEDGPFAKEDPVPEIEPVPEREPDHEDETFIEDTHIDYEDNNNPETMMEDPAEPADMRPPAASSDKGASSATLQTPMSILYIVSIFVISLQQVFRDVIW